MIKFLKLSNGDEIIGKIEGDTDAFYNVSDPMMVIGLREDNPYSGGMRLRHCLSLSADDFLSIPIKDVILTYTPSKAMEDYYHQSVIYNNIYVIPEIERQVIESTKELTEVVNKIISGVSKFETVEPKGKKILQ